MQAINELIRSLTNKSTDESGVVVIGDKRYSTMYDSIELTEEEIYEAIYNAKKQKYYKLKEQAYWEKVNSIRSKWDGFTSSILFDYFISRLVEKINAKPTESSLKILKELSRYYTGGETKLNPYKGLLFVGGTGTGKTVMASAVQSNPRYEYELTTAKNIAECYEIGGDHWKQWINPNKAVIIDDMGDEKVAQVSYKKTQVEAIDELLKSRYDTRSYSNIIITTNLNGEAIGSRYGDRLRSRMREMFNIVNFGNDDLRK